MDWRAPVQFAGPMADNASHPQRPPPAAPTNAEENNAVTTSLPQSWLQQGEQLYQTALDEYHALEQQLEELEQKLVAKQSEVNQIAGVIGKPPVEGTRRLSTELMGGQILEDAPRVPALSTPPGSSSNANIARALTGKFGR